MAAISSRENELIFLYNRYGFSMVTDSLFLPHLTNLQPNTKMPELVAKASENYQWLILLRKLKRVEQNCCWTLQWCFKKIMGLFSGSGHGFFVKFSLAMVELCKICIGCMSSLVSEKVFVISIWTGVISFGSSGLSLVQVQSQIFNITVSL